MSDGLAAPDQPRFRMRDEPIGNVGASFAS